MLELLAAIPVIVVVGFYLIVYSVGVLTDKQNVFR